MKLFRNEINNSIGLEFPRKKGIMRVGLLTFKTINSKGHKYFKIGYDIINHDHKIWSFSFLNFQIAIKENRG